MSDRDDPGAPDLLKRARQFLSDRRWSREAQQGRRQDQFKAHHSISSLDFRFIFTNIHRALPAADAWLKGKRR
jgi:hypothetical protein